MAPHVVFLQGSCAGHINPTIPLVAALRGYGCLVSYFAVAEGVEGEVVNADTPLGKAVIAAGGMLHPYRVDPLLKEEPRLSHAWWFDTLPGLLEDLRALQPPPAVILYEPFVPARAIAPHILSIPSIALVPYSGPGIMAVSETEKTVEEAAGAREWLQELFGLDLFELGVPMQSWYAPKLNLVLCCEELYAPMCTEAQQRLWAPACFRCVGTMSDRAEPNKSHRPAQEGFPLEEVKAARASGKRVILFSLGSMVTGRFFESKLGVHGSHIENNADEMAVGGTTLGVMTGAEFARFAFRCVFDALGGRDELLVVLACGQRGAEVVLGGLAPAPSNFLPVALVPQLELLPLCSAFITHGGMGSAMEALLFRVPMVVIPVYGDQMWNADHVASAGLGVGFRYPLRTLKAEALREAVYAVSDPSLENPYRHAVEAAASKMERTGGAQNAAQLVLQAATGCLL